MRNEIELVENKDLRNEMIDKVQVLDKVKCLVLLPNDLGATTEMVANYFEVPVPTIKSVILEHEEELNENGLTLRTRKNLLESNVPIKIKRGGFDILDEDNNVVVSGSNKGITLFNKRTILNVAMLLRDSKVADSIKQELGLPTSSNIKYRLEKKFEGYLKDVIKEVYLNLYEQHVTNRVIEEMNNVLHELLKYKTQYPINNGEFRIDFYFPLLNIAIEYDEKYHRSSNQKLKDKIRDEKIHKYLYIDKHYTLSDIDSFNEDCEKEEWKISSLEELYEIDKDFDMFYDTLQVVRVNESEEIIGCIKVATVLTKTILNLFDGCGMGCNYKKLLDEKYLFQ